MNKKTIKSDSLRPLAHRKRAANSLFQSLGHNHFIISVLPIPRIEGNEAARDWFVREKVFSAFMRCSYLQIGKPCITHFSRRWLRLVLPSPIARAVDRPPDAVTCISLNFTKASRRQGSARWILYGAVAVNSLDVSCSLIKLLLKSTCLGEVTHRRPRARRVAVTRFAEALELLEPDS